MPSEQKEVETGVLPSIIHEGRNFKQFSNWEDFECWYTNSRSANQVLSIFKVTLNGEILVIFGDASESCVKELIARCERDHDLRRLNIARRLNQESQEQKRPISPIEEPSSDSEALQEVSVPISARLRKDLRGAPQRIPKAILQVLEGYR
jgi:hypothetical protein